ncbi:MAG TPA: class I SAM-dependent methyltransferase, partial [Noviherbaspirillum sp.]
MSDSFYRAFEDKHRGSRELIKSRLQAYAPFIQPLTALYQPAIALDLGCGRGEWLELAAETGFDARGVDLDEGMLQACRERGLNATHTDALVALRALPDNSIALVSAFHVVEHMPFDVARAVIADALRVLQPGGLLILETPNPDNLIVGASRFYQDPSHERPIPPELLRFAVEHAGFHRTKFLGLQEPPALHTAAEVRLFQVLNDVSPDYAVVAQKAASQDLLAPFDTPFSTKFGISLHTLAERYDVQAEQRIAEVKTLLSETEARVVHTSDHLSDRLARLEEQLVRQFDQLNVRIAQSESNASDALANAAEAKERAIAAEARATAAEARNAEANAQVQAMLNSRSWRITAPLRAAGSVFYRVRSAVREGRVKSGLKRRVKVL